MSATLANEGHQRSLKDFLTLYNTITENCFNKCVSNFNDRSASSNESVCVDICTDNYVQYNQRFMFNFVDHQERRKKDQERLVIEAAAKEAASAQPSQTEQLTPAQEEQIQKSSQLLENLSAPTSSGVNSGDGLNTSHSSLLDETLKESPVISSDTLGGAHHVGNVNS
uniref:Tim10-like domain-containing protein n=1 Tax=Arion vulgaris TaxID=1028688 RepID=A0A0B7BVW7_9EUPU